MCGELHDINKRRFALNLVGAQFVGVVSAECVNLLYLRPKT